MATSSSGNNDNGPVYLPGVEVQRRFIAFFEARQHKHVPSSSLVPHNDPTVLLTTAGMQQMTPYFLGLETPPADRMVSVQKCFRTVDIEEVGDESHCTFFFMLGNFSVGDYFKRESLLWSWEFLTEDLGIPADRLYPTIHPEDETANRIWREDLNIPEERIGKLEDNWWGPVGPTGPNGPDSEIYYDLGPEFDDGSGLGPGDNDRYLEVWNNVFMEFFQQADGSREPLPRQNVDTGMGLERLAMVMQGARSIYDTDLYQPIIQRAASLSGREYGLSADTDSALRIIADHARGGTFLISDGVLPGNEGRSYVLRRILRRAIRSGRKIGLDKPFLAEMAGMVIDQFGEDFPALRDRRSQIERVLTYEEESFGRTLSAGENRFQVLTEELVKRNESTLAGEEAFKLYDTFGFPYDLTLDLAREQGIDVDHAGFERAMAAQREASRGGAAFKDSSAARTELYVDLAGGQKTEFLGYEDVRADIKIIALAGPDGRLETAEAGDAVEVLLDRTPFYGESGGQVGDTGHIRTDTGLLRVEDTHKPAPDLFLHRGVVEEGFVRTGETGHAEIDAGRRQSIRRNHTATHLLHRALRIVLGTETHQAGSLVAPGRLRFDFTSLDAVRPEQVERVAEIVNAEILQGQGIETGIKSYDEAVAGGAMALFGEKYGDTVRVVSVPGFSMELCGGTHVHHTGEIGPFLITAEGSVAAGVRRIEALTGAVAVDRMLAQQRIAERTARELRTTWESIPTAITALQERVRTQERDLDRLRRQAAGAGVGDLVGQAVNIDGTRVLAARVDADTKETLRQIGDQVRDRLESGVIVLGTVIDNRPSLISLVSADLIERGVRAGDIVRETATLVDGRGGGRPDRAEAGGKDASRLDEALSAVAELVKRELGATR
ncbi:MAG: alanine--tRNA ligase [Thermomicrobiales bacterium]